MGATQPLFAADRLTLSYERLGAVALINHFLERLALERHLEHFVPTTDRRVRLPYAKALGVLVRSLLIEREPEVSSTRDGRDVCAHGVRLGPRDG